MSEIAHVRPTPLPAMKQETNPWLESAKETGGAALGKLLKFSKGRYETKDGEIAPGTELIAYVDQVARGWVKFVDNKLVDRQIHKIGDSGHFPAREELGDLDERTWEYDQRARKVKDPWNLQWFLPMQLCSTGEILMFVTSSSGGIGAIGKLNYAFGRRLSTGHPPASPYIKLRVSDYKHHEFGRIFKPEFDIVGWETPGASPEVSMPSPHSMAEEMDDEIPF